MARAPGQADAGGRSRALAIAFGVAVLVFALDQITKAWVWSELRGQAPRVLLDGWLEFRFAFNPGAAFGMGSQLSSPRVVFTALALLSSTVFTALLWVWPPRRTWVLAGIGGSIGGALGNAFDRWTRVHERRVYDLGELDFSELLAAGPNLVRSFDGYRNFVDVPDHGVVDFIVVYLGPDRPWPAFNLADVALSVGMFAVALWLWSLGSSVDAPESETDPSSEMLATDAPTPDAPTPDAP